VNLGRRLREVAARDTTRPALLGETGRLSYGELEQRTAIAAANLRARGVAPGDRVALLLPNGPTFAAAFLATLRLGAVAVPLNVLLAKPEVEARLTISGATLLVDDEESIGDDLEPLDVCADVAGRDAAVVLFTSGTSGKPKGAILTHRGLEAAARNAAGALRLDSGDVVLGAAPFSHVLGLATGVVATLLSGSAIAVVRRFQAETTLGLMVETETTILLGVPTMLIALCDAARAATALPPVRIAHVGGASVPVEVARDFERTFGGEVYEGYGLTELSGIATTYIAGQRRKPGSVGLPLGGTELKIVSLDGHAVRAGEIGEVHVRGPSVIPGYWEDAEATAETLDADGWLSTGDVGYVDDEGYLFLVDRKRELIIRGGYNVYPREVEEVLYAHPAVLEAAVVGVPHETLGEEVAALIVPRPGSAPDPDALRVWAKERLAAYKYPRIVAVVDDLPRGPSGKILKRAIDREALLP
jgi:long-chain acyl-CoA synthetase